MQFQMSLNYGLNEIVKEIEWKFDEEKRRIGKKIISVKLIKARLETKIQKI